LNRPPSLPTHAHTRRAALGLLAAAGATSPAHAQLGDFLNKLVTPPTTTPQPGATPAVVAGPQGIVPRGYSERFLPVRDMIAEGRYADAASRFGPAAKPDPSATAAATSAPGAGAGAATPPPGPIVSDPFLANAEAGLILFEGGSADDAVTHLRAAEDSQTPQPTASNTTKAKNFLTGAGRMVAGKVTGQEELAVYHPLDHEQVLQLNYLSLAYLLQGERRCYNVTRRCIEQQSLLKDKFDKEIEEYKSKYDQQVNDKKVTDADRTSLDSMAAQFKANDAEATRVPNAYVNPLGDYLNGVIQEIVSHEQPSLRDNSRIAYLNAAKLCGLSPQLTAAAAAMARPRPPANERVLHVVVGEGFAPSRDVLTFGLALHGTVVLVRVPIFKPVPSPVHKIVAHSAGGAALATLDPIGDFEAIRMRDQHDRLPEIMFGVAASTLASYVEGQALNHFGLFGQAIHSVRDMAATPDTRSWLSLPRRFHVARIALPRNAQAVNLVAYDAGGRRLNSQTAPLLASEQQSIVYARSTGEGMRVQAARKLWIEGRLEDNLT